MFVRSELAGDIADQAVGINAKAVWFQLDVVDQDAYTRTTAAGLTMVMDHCPAIEWGRLGPISSERALMFTIDTSTGFGKRIARQLDDEQVVWLTTSPRPARRRRPRSGSSGTTTRS